MHTIKITPNLLFEYQCTSGKFIRLPNLKLKLFCPSWNAVAKIVVFAYDTVCLLFTYFVAGYA